MNRIAGLAKMYSPPVFHAWDITDHINSCDTFAFYQCVNTCAEVQKEWQLKQIKAKVACLLLPNYHISALALASPHEYLSLSIYIARARPPRRHGKRRKEAARRHK